MIPVRTGRLDGMVTHDAADALAPLFASFADGSEPSDADVVKQSTVRRVLRIHAPVDVHVKVHRPARLADRVRDSIRGDRGTVEFDALREAAARGIPCVTPLAAGRLRGDDGARAFLVTRTAPGTPMSRGPWPARSAAAAGRLLRTVHDAGLHARDLHPGNVLDADGDLTLLDLTSATFAQPLDAADRAHGLATFCLALDGGVRHPGAAPLLAAYGASPTLIATAARFGRRLRHRALSAFGRRAARACRHTRIEERRGERWAMHVPTAALHDDARTAILAPERTTVWKTGRRGSVARFGPVVVKEREAAAARRLFAGAYLLSFAGVPTPAPVALRIHGGRGRAAFVAIDAPDLKRSHANLTPDERRDAAERIGDAVGRLHGHGLRHRDLKLENLVRTSDGVVWVVDLDGLRRRAPIEIRGRGADVGRLLAAFRDTQSEDEPSIRRAFWRGYTRATRCLLPNRNPRRLRRLIEARARAWAADHERADDH